MKLRTNYTEMTNTELLEELNHRHETFCDTFGGYEEGGISVGYQHKAYWLNEVQEDGFTLSRLFDDPNDHAMVRLDDPEFRPCVLSMLQEPFITKNSDEPSELEDQLIRLEGIWCKVCDTNMRENKGNVFLEHLDDDEDETPEEWAKYHTAEYYEDGRMHKNSEVIKNYILSARKLAETYKLEVWKQRANALERILSNEK